jgi:hypothetical protein
MKFHLYPAITGLSLALALPMASLAQSNQGMDPNAQMNMQMPMHSQMQSNGQMPMSGQMQNGGQMQGAGQAGGQIPKEPGQSAFATIAEIVRILQADPDTDWDAVNIDALRMHLVDMDAVTLRAQAVATNVEGGAAFDVTSTVPRVTQAVRAMTIGHARTMSGVGGLTIEASEIDNGARMVVTGDNAAMIRGLGFFGVLGLGNHHQPHHIALARGEIAPRG